jgi:serine/threonine protein kinase
MSDIPLDLRNATDEDLTEICAKCSKVLYEILGGAKVVQISYQIVVKIGATEQEAENQRIARSLVDLKIAYVPEVYRFFTLRGCGYLVMEYIDGNSFMETPNATSCMLSVLDHFSQIQSSKSGPFAGGPPQGLIWQESRETSMSSLKEVESYFNIRLQKHSKSIEFSGPVVFCHLDLADRNVIYRNNGSVCILDWKSAGFYPRSLEFSALYLNRRYDDQLVIQTLRALQQDNLLQESSVYIEHEIELLLEAWVIDQKYWL